MKIELFQGDCLELMKGIPGGSVDMVMADLPYGTTKNKWDKTIPLAQAERNESLGIYPNKVQLEFAQRYVYSGCFRRETWEKYMKRKEF